jgi:hypothetical protein
MGAHDDVQTDRQGIWRKRTKTPRDIHAQVNEIAALDSVLTLRIDQEPLMVSNMATVLTAVTRLHAKLWLIEQNRGADVMEYAMTHDRLVTEEAKLTALSITQNSPVTIKLLISAKLGKALASLIDAVTQARHRYQLAKLEVERMQLALQAEGQKRLAVARAEAAELQEAKRERDFLKRERELRLREREVELQRRTTVVQSEELAMRELLVNIQMNIRKHALEQAILEVEQLNSSAALETREMMAQSLMEELLQFSATVGLAVVQLEPKKSA